MTRFATFHHDSEAMIKRSRKAYATAIASINAFGEALANLPSPPWNTLNRQMLTAPEKRPETPRNRPE